MLDEFEPLEPRAKRQLAAVTIDFSSVLVPRLERTIAERARPFVLVIDDAHRLRRRAVWALMQALADCVPSGSQLVLVSRSEPDLALGACAPIGAFIRCQPPASRWTVARHFEMLEASRGVVVRLAGRSPVGTDRGLGQSASTSPAWRSRKTATRRRQPQIRG